MVIADSNFDFKLILNKILITFTILFIFILKLLFKTHLIVI